MEHWKKVDFLKLGFPCNNSTDTYLVSNEGRIRKINKNGIEKYIGRYSLKKSDIKYMGTSIQIKCIVASAFFLNINMEFIKLILKIMMLEIAVLKI